MKKLDGIEDKSLTWNLLCNSIKQNEAIGSREKGVIEGDRTLFGDASRVSGDALSEVWQEGVSL